MYEFYIIIPIGYQHIPSYTQEHAINVSINIKINNNVLILYLHICWISTCPFI